MPARRGAHASRGGKSRDRARHPTGPGPRPNSRRFPTGTEFDSSPSRPAPAPVASAAPWGGRPDEHEGTRGAGRPEPRRPARVLPPPCRRSRPGPGPARPSRACPLAHGGGAGLLPVPPRRRPAMRGRRPRRRRPRGGFRGSGRGGIAPPRSLRGDPRARPPVGRGAHLDRPSGRRAIPGARLGQAARPALGPRGPLPRAHRWDRRALPRQPGQPHGLPERGPGAADGVRGAGRPRPRHRGARDRACAARRRPPALRDRARREAAPGSSASPLRCGTCSSWCGASARPSSPC